MLPFCIASRMRCNINQAVFWVTPSARPNSQELIPFLAFTIIQNAGSHLSNPRGLSSKMVPTLTENCFLQSRHFQSFRVARKATLPVLQQGQIALPSGQRIEATKFKAVSVSEKYLIASISVSGNAISFVMRTKWRKNVGESSI